MKKLERSRCSIRMQVVRLREPVYCWAGHVSTILQGVQSLSFGNVYQLTCGPQSFLEMVRSAATSFPASVYEPPPESASTAPALNLNLGGVNVSLGGSAGTGVYRTSGEDFGVQADGIRDGVRSLIGKVKQGVDRIGLQ
jgi:hypothetical protein